MMRVYCHTCRQYSQNFNEETQTCIYCNSIFIDRIVQEVTQIVQEVTRIPFSGVDPNQRSSTSPQITSQALYVSSDEFFIDNSDQVTVTAKEYLRRVAAMKSRQFDQSRYGETICVICLESLKNTVAELKCGHVYHRFCIQKWLKQKNMCPLCIVAVAP